MIARLTLWMHKLLQKDKAAYLLTYMSVVTVTVALSESEIDRYTSEGPSSLNVNRDSLEKTTPPVQ